MRLAGILFDKDGTLVDFDATWGGAAQAVMHHMSAGDQTVYARLAEAMHFVTETKRFRPTSPMIAGSTADYGPVWAQILGRSPDTILFDEIDRRMSDVALESLSPVGEPAAVFAVLKRQGLRLGIATNDAEASARVQSERLGLLPYLDFISGYDTGHGGKPDPGMIMAFARQIGVTPNRIALVGDSIHDLEAAQAAGGTSVAVLSGPASRAELEPHADHVIETIADLPALVAALDPSRRVDPAG